MRTPWNRILGATRNPRNDERLQSQGDAGEFRFDVPPEDIDAPPPPRLGSLDQLGQRNELLSVRFAAMADRLEDLKSLANDFNELTVPIEELAADLPRAKSKVLEVEALLADEREEKQATRNELNALVSRFADLRDDHESIATLNRSLREALDKSETGNAANRIALGEARNLLANAERQIEVQNESREQLEGELGLLNSELFQLREGFQKADELATRQANKIAVIENENQHLNKVASNHLRQIADLQAKADENEKLVLERTQELFELRNHLESERSEFQKNLSLRESALAALNSENSALSLRVESFTARHQAQERNLEQLRAGITDREAAFRTANDTIRANSKEAASLARQVDGLTQSLGEHADQLRRNQRLLEEMTARNDMLTKALAGKDAALTNAVDKVNSRSERIEELTKRLEQDRMAAEAAKRRLLEELENEKSERTLAQGALKIARESRASLQRQNESLRRANRSLRNSGADGEADDLLAEPTNVSLFAAARARDEGD